MAKVIKISDENYEFLLKETAKLQYNSQKKSTFDDAITYIKENQSKSKQATLLSLAGSWSKISEDEFAKYKQELKKGWKSWEKYA
jgi:hypothetical protein